MSDLDIALRYFLGDEEATVVDPFKPADPVPDPPLTPVAPLPNDAGHPKGDT